MLRIFYGRENINKDKFLFKNTKGRTLLLVPDQFTLQAERDAFFYLGAKGLMDLEVVSISRLGLKVMAETGGGRTALIDKYGRHMLLTKILSEKRDALGIYRGMEKKQSFIEMVNNFISEIKQYGAGPEDLKQIAEELDQQTYLHKKLKDMAVIFESYQEHIQGKYLDTEDQVSLYADKIPKSQAIKESEIWIYGFDSFTPKNMQVIGKLMQTAKQVNLILTCSSAGRDDDLFALPRTLMKRFQDLAQEEGVAWEAVSIDEEEFKIREKAASIQTLEQELYAVPVRPSEENESITLVKAANFYNEAESAAAEVLSLVRDQGMEYKDIILICNDMETRGTIAKRVFSQYGIPLFLDKKQNIIHNPASVFILSLLEISSKGYRTESLFRLMKTGLTPLSWDRIEDLENYARKYRIQGNRWKSSFTKGTSEYGQERMQELEASRAELMALLEPFRREFGKGSTVKERVRLLYDYLTGACMLPQKLEAMMVQQEEQGFLDAAGETAQVWGLVMDVLDQFVEIVGDETILAERFGEILKAGLESIEVGLLPPSADGLIMGTMQRTRSSHVKALLILGANEGLLPASAVSESILNEDEKRFLAARQIEICKVDEVRVQEEKLAIYKNLSRPSKRLWMSYSVSDGEGKEIKPSQIFTKLRDIYPEICIQPDLVSRGSAEDLIQAENAAMEHMTAALRTMLDGQEPDPVWQEALSWYKEKGSLSSLKEGLLFTGKQQTASKKLIRQLYKRETAEDLSVSPSRLELYSRCPFSHFISYGLRPLEQRIFEVGGRELGDLYHTCLMELSKWLTQDGIPVSDEKSMWMTVSKEECSRQIERILKEQAPQYREGLMEQGKEERYRSDRLAEICSEISWILIDHVRRGSIRTMEFEQTFGRGRKITPVTVETKEGTVFIEGKIDRVDVLSDGRVKIIDYKTGYEKFDINEVKKGFRLQLMLYLRAAQQNTREPAGVFYFLISEPSVSAEGISPDEIDEKVKQETKKACRMDGILVDDPQAIQNIAGEFSGFSDIVPVRQTKKGYSGTGPDKLLDQETFSQLQKEVDEKVKELCSGLLCGDIRVMPKKSGQISACTYCKYKGICQFDLAFENCRYEII